MVASSAPALRVRVPLPASAAPRANLARARARRDRHPSRRRLPPRRPSPSQGWRRWGRSAPRDCWRRGAWFFGSQEPCPCLQKGRAPDPPLDPPGRQRALPMSRRFRLSLSPVPPLSALFPSPGSFVLAGAQRGSSPCPPCRSPATLRRRRRRRPQCLLRHRPCGRASCTRFGEPFGSTVDGCRSTGGHGVLRARGSSRGRGGRGGGCTKSRRPSGNRSLATAANTNLAWHAQRSSVVFGACKAIASRLFSPSVLSSMAFSYAPDHARRCATCSCTTRRVTAF